MGKKHLLLWVQWILVKLIEELQLLPSETPLAQRRPLGVSTAGSSMMSQLMFILKARNRQSAARQNANAAREVELVAALRVEKLLLALDHDTVAAVEVLLHVAKGVLHAHDDEQQDNGARTSSPPSFQRGLISRYYHSVPKEKAVLAIDVQEKVRKRKRDD